MSTGNKATPIAQLPQMPMPGDGNVQMSMDRGPPQGMMQQQPPAPMNDPTGAQQQHQQQDLHAASAAMAAQQAAEREASQAQFMERQFVNSYPQMQQMPEDDHMGGRLIPENPYMQNQYAPPGVVPPQFMGGAPGMGYPEPDLEKPSFMGLLMANAKIFVLLVALLFVVQMAGTRSIFLRAASFLRLPEGMLLPGSKAIASVVGALAFIFAMQQLT